MKLRLVALTNSSENLIVFVPVSCGLHRVSLQPLVNRGERLFSCGHPHLMEEALASSRRSVFVFLHLILAP